MGIFSVQNILTIVCVGYMSLVIYELYKLVIPKECTRGTSNCLKPKFAPDKDGLFPPLQLRVYVSPKDGNIGNLLLKVNHFQLGSEFEKRVNLSITNQMRQNSTTIYTHCILLPNDYEQDYPYDSAWYVSQTEIMTVHQLPVPETFNLMGKGMKSVEEVINMKGKPVPHIPKILPLASPKEMPNFDADLMEYSVKRLVSVDTKTRGLYLPFLLIDTLSMQSKDLIELKPSLGEVELTVHYRPLSVAKYLLLVHMGAACKQMKQSGFDEKSIDQVKSLLVDTSLYLIGATFIISAIHMLLDILSFKNDISFWRKKNDMVGMSSKTLIWRAFSYTVLFLHLSEENTSMLVVIPMGISALIEYWKLIKAFKISFSFSGGFKFGEHSSKETETEQFDNQAMKYLAYLLAPLCVAGAIYSLAYVPHKSWRSWLLTSLANGVYAFGFLFMLPQLFLNYKLKSVAHLPWKAFTYKAINTFIDDLFVMIINTPTAYRIACFRDDVVFIIYLYQRWLYPVDYKRVNEFGQSGDENQEKSIENEQYEKEKKVKSGKNHEKEE